MLLEQLDITRRTGDLAAVDPQQLAFQLHACVLEANWAAQLFGQPRRL